MNGEGLRLCFFQVPSQVWPGRGVLSQVVFALLHFMLLAHVLVLCCKRSVIVGNGYFMCCCCGHCNHELTRYVGDFGHIYGDV